METGGAPLGFMGDGGGESESMEAPRGRKKEGGGDFQGREREEGTLANCAFRPCLPGDRAKRRRRRRRKGGVIKAGK